MYAIIQTGGKQLKVEAGQAIYVEKLANEAGVEGATVEGTVEKQGREKKVVTFKYKPKKHQHTKQGHRQPYTKVVIDAINA